MAPQKGSKSSSAREHTLRLRTYWKRFRRRMAPSSDQLPSEPSCSTGERLCSHTRRGASVQRSTCSSDAMRESSQSREYSMTVGYVLQPDHHTGSLLQEQRKLVSGPEVCAGTSLRWCMRFSPPWRGCSCIVVRHHRQEKEGQGQKVRTHHSLRRCTLSKVHVSALGYPFFARCSPRLNIPLAARTSFSMNLNVALALPARPTVTTVESFIVEVEGVWTCSAAISPGRDCEFRDQSGRYHLNPYKVSHKF